MGGNNSIKAYLPVSEDVHARLWSEMGREEEPRRIALRESTGTPDKESGAPGQVSQSPSAALSKLDLHQDFDSESPSVPCTAVADHDSEESDAEDDNPNSQLPLEKKLYFMQSNCSKYFRVNRYKKAGVPKWKLLPRKTSVLLGDVELKVGDLVETQLNTNPMAVAEIAEICDLQDGRHILRIYWFAKRLSALERLRKAGSRDTIPSNYRFIKKAHTQVIMWDTVKRQLNLEERKKCKTDEVFYCTGERTQLYSADSETVGWTKVEKA